MKTSFWLLAIALVLTGCRSESEPAPSIEELQAQRALGRAEALAEIEKANAEIPRLVGEGDFEAAGAYFAEDVVQMISGQPPINGRQAWIEAQRQAAEIGDWKLDLEVLDFEYMGDKAVERGRGVQTFIANENSPIPSMEMTGDYLVLWVRGDSGWQIQYDYVVLETPEMGPEGQ